METVQVWRMHCYLPSTIQSPLLARAVEALHKPSLCAIYGAATGADPDMALMADSRYAARSARLAEGLVPGDGEVFFIAAPGGLDESVRIIVDWRFSQR